MENLARGTVEVTLHPNPPHDTVDGVALARIKIDKVFRGDLQGTGHVDMLSAGGSVQGSAGYVALERVSGTLQGKRGTFVLQHTGIMNRGAPSLQIAVVPDTGTGELKGLSGRFVIDMDNGQHSYLFTYAWS